MKKLYYFLLFVPYITLHGMRNDMNNVFDKMLQYDNKSKQESFKSKFGTLNKKLTDNQRHLLLSKSQFLPFTDEQAKKSSHKSQYKSTGESS